MDRTTCIWTYGSTTICVYHVFSIFYPIHTRILHKAKILYIKYAACIMWYANANVKRGGMYFFPLPLCIGTSKSLIHSRSFTPISTRADSFVAFTFAFAFQYWDRFTFVLAFAFRFVPMEAPQTVYMLFHFLLNRISIPHTMCKES